MIGKLKGSLTVEASLTVPFVILMMLPFLYLLRSVYVYDCVRTAVFESAQMIETVLYITNYMEEDKKEEDNENSDIDINEEAQNLIGEYADLFEILESITGETSIDELADNMVLQQVVRFFVYELTKEQNLEEWGLSDGSFEISYIQSRFFYEEDGREALFCIIAEYEFEFPFVSQFVRMKPVEIQCVGRAFVGKEMDTESRVHGSSNATETWYRIGNGNHYHESDCYLIAKERVELMREDAEKQGYAACRTCDPSQLAAVRVTIGGEKYHAAGCRYIAPELTEMNQEQIQKNGYMPCEICIGGGEWFQ